jgi:hypothetical protein
MKRSMSLQESTDITHTSRPPSIVSDGDAKSDIKEHPGLIHLLQNNTIDDLDDEIDDAEFRRDYSDDNSTTEANVCPLRRLSVGLRCA